MGAPKCKFFPFIIFSPAVVAFVARFFVSSSKQDAQRIFVSIPPDQVLLFFSSNNEAQLNHHNTTLLLNKNVQSQLYFHKHIYPQFQSSNYQKFFSWGIYP